MKRVASLYSLPALYESVTRLHTETEKEIEALHALFSSRSVRSVLDVACGIGRLSIPLAQRGYEVVGIDLSESQIAYAQKHAQELGAHSAHFRVEDANSFSFPGEFDAAICMWTTFAEEPLIQEQIADNVSRSLAPGGIFVIENRWWDAVLEPQRTIKNFALPDGTPVVQTIEDAFVGAVRKRTIDYVIGDKHFVDYRSTKVLRHADIETILARHGFAIVDHITGYKHKNDTLIVGQKGNGSL